MPTQGGSGSFIEAARRAQLVEAAVATVNELGYHRASLAEIAGRAGIVKSAVAYYFASKEGLLLSVVQTVFGTLGESVLAAVDGIEDPIARLRAYADAYFRLRESLEALLGDPVDLVTPANLENPYFRERVEQEKTLLYAA